VPVMLISIDPRKLLLSQGLFREFFATGMSWRAAFWCTHRRRLAVQRLAKESNLIAVSLSGHFD